MVEVNGSSKRSGRRDIGVRDEVDGSVGSVGSDVKDNSRIHSEVVEVDGLK